MNGRLLEIHARCHRYFAGVGAGAGRAATSAAVSAGVGLATERSQTVEGDAKHTADEITKVLKTFFADQGWIARQ